MGIARIQLLASVIQNQNELMNVRKNWTRHILDVPYWVSETVDTILALNDDQLEVYHFLLLLLLLLLIELLMHIELVKLVMCQGSG
jgi:hypothetical protein